MDLLYDGHLIKIHKQDPVTSLVNGIHNLLRTIPKINSVENTSDGGNSEVEFEVSMGIPGNTGDPIPPFNPEIF
ncbi:MAG: hypothetical protein RQ885_02380 [Desulfurococcales archaeon]|nr:hypothetical protein [Desulfurococcales archaeon]